MIPDILSFEPVAWLLRGGLYLSGVGLVALALRRKSPGWRALVWRCAMVGLLATVPLVVFGSRAVVRGQAPVLGAGDVGGPMIEAESVAALELFVETVEAPTAPPSVAVENIAKARPVNFSPPSVAERIIDWAMVVWWVWGAGACVVWMRWARSVWRRRRWERGATDLAEDATWRLLLREVTAGDGRVRLLAHAEVPVPCAWGIWRPTILMPATATDWPLDHRRLALAHEWTHLRRHDPFWQALSVVALAVHWANPLAWIMMRRWRIAEEEVADDMARVLATPVSYAALLVACARSLQSTSGLVPEVPASSSMAHPSTVPDRVERVLDDRRDRRESGAPQRVIAVVAAACLIGAIAFFTPDLVAQDTAPPREETPKTGAPGSSAAVPDFPPDPPTLPPPASATDPLAPAATPATGPTAAITSTIEEKLRSIVIPNVVFENATLEEAIEFLRVKSKELDTTTTDRTQRGVNFILVETTGKKQKTGTINLTNVPLGVVVKALCDQTGVKSRVEPFAVILSDAAFDANSLYTKIYRVPPDFFNLAGGALVETGALSPKPTAIDILQQAGIHFPESASAFFNPATSTLTVRNTSVALDQVDQFVQSISPRARKQINVRAYLYRLPTPDALEVAESLDSVLDASATVRKLRALSTAGGHAVLLAAPSVHTRSGDRVRSGAVRRRLPAESPPAAAGEPADASLAPATPPNPFDTRDEAFRKLAADAAQTVEPSDTTLGCVLEVEPILGPDGHTLDVSATVTYSAPGRSSKERPLLGTLTTSTILFAGQMRLLGTLSGGEDEATMTLVFLKADVATTP